MKKITILFFFVYISVTAQKTDRTNFNSLQNVVSTDFVVTFTSNYSKVFNGKEDSKIVFVNTKTNSVNEITIPKKSTIRKVITTIEANYLASRFVLVECYSEVEKRLPKASNSVNQLYLISLNDFKLIKITSDDFALRNWELNEKTNKIVFIEQENGMKDLSGEVQKIMIFDLNNGTKKEVFSNN